MFVKNVCTLDQPFNLMDSKKTFSLYTAHIAGRETVATKCIRGEFTHWCSFSPCTFFFFANEVRISTKRRYPTLRKGTLLLSKYMQEAFALIQDIVPSHCQPGFLFHTSSTMSRPHRFCAVLEDCIATEEEKGNNGSNTSEFEGISNPSSRGGQPNCPWNENIFLHIWSCH